MLTTLRTDWLCVQYSIIKLVCGMHNTIYDLVTALDYHYALTYTSPMGPCSPGWNFDFDFDAQYAPSRVKTGLNARVSCIKIYRG